MTDAKDVREARRIIETWREESPHLVQPEHWIPPIIALLDSFDTLTRERDEARDAFDTVISLAPIYCERLHHTKKDYHESGEPCPVEARIKTLIQIIEGDA
jgi:hypothetical protein